MHHILCPPFCLMLFPVSDVELYTFYGVVDQNLNTVTAKTRPKSRLRARDVDKKLYCVKSSTYTLSDL